jgi:hypothetical protein
MCKNVEEENMDNIFKLEISRVADTLVNQASLFNCGIEKAWNKYMHPVITEQFTFDEVKKYIDSKISMGKD